MPSLLQSRYSTYVAWVGKKSGPLTTMLSNMEEVDAFLAPVKVESLSNMGGQEIRTSDHSSLCLQVAVIGFFKNLESAEAQAFVKAAEAVDDQVRSFLLS
jgi:hypothetical protein